MKFQAASWQFAPETSATHPKTQPATHLKTQNCKESAAWTLVPDHFWQRTSNDGNRLATHLKIRIQCPEPTPNYDLAAGNAPETTKRPQITLPAALPTCSWNEDPGKKRWERGSPPKTERRVEKQQGTRKLRTNPDFGRTMISKTKTHKGMVKEQKRTSAKQNRHQINEQHIWTSERQDSQQRNKGKQKKKMLSFRMSNPKVQVTSCR